MAVPIRFDPKVEEWLDKQHPTGLSRIDAIRQNKCVNCGQPAKNFRFTSYRMEYKRTGFCQACQLFKVKSNR